MVEAMEIQEGFQNTDAGIIPIDWKAKKLSEISAFENGKAHEQFIDDKGDFIVVNSKFISTEGKVQKFSNKNLSPLQKGNIAIVMSDIPNGKALAKCFLIDKNNRYTLNQRIGCIKANEEIDDEYLFYKLNRNKYFLAFDSGTGQTNLKKSEIQDCRVPLPPTKSEQTAIATALNDADALITQLEKLIAKKRNIKQGAMQELITGEKRLPGFEKKNGYKQTEVGIIPSDWELKKLTNIAEICTGSTPPTSDHNNYGNDYFFVTPADLGKGRLIQNTEKKLSTKGFNLSRKYPKKSILFTCIGSTIGKSGIADRELTSNQQINAIFPNTTFDSDYLYYVLNLLSNRIKKGAGETAVPIINKSDFGELPIPLPPTKAEQTRIAQILSDMDAEIEALEKKLEKYNMIKLGMMQELLTGKTRLV